MAKALEDDIKQSKPFRSLREETYLTLIRAAGDLELQIAQGLKPFDITPTQYNVLRILRGAGDQGLCRNEVGERLVRSVPDVTRLLDRMEDARLIIRERDDRDRRLVATRLTARGLELVNKLDTVVDGLHARHLGHMSRRDLTTLRDLLVRVRDAG